MKTHIILLWIAVVFLSYCVLDVVKNPALIEPDLIEGALRLKGGQLQAWQTDGWIMADASTARPGPGWRCANSEVAKALEIIGDSDGLIWEFDADGIDFVDIPLTEEYSGTVATDLNICYPDIANVILSYKDPNSLICDSTEKDWLSVLYRLLAGKKAEGDVRIFFKEPEPLADK